MTKIGQTDLANNAREVSGLASNRYSKLTLKRNIAGRNAADCRKKIARSETWQNDGSAHGRSA